MPGRAPPRLPTPDFPKTAHERRLERLCLNMATRMFWARPWRVGWGPNENLANWRHCCDRNYGRVFHCGKQPDRCPTECGPSSEVSEESSNYIAPFAMPDEPPKEALMLSEEKSGPKGLETQPAKSEGLFSAQTKDQTRLQDDFSSHNQQARLEEDDDYFSVRDYSRDAYPRSQIRSYLSYYPYAELPPERKPADIVLDSLRNVQIGTPLEEIKRASDAFGLDFSFMRTVAKIESILIQSNAPDRILVCSSLASTSSQNMDLEKLLALATMLSPRPTSL